LGACLVGGTNPICYHSPMPTPLLPVSMRQVSDHQIGIDWNTGHKSVFEVRALRIACQCAQCIDEMSGKKTLDESSVPMDVKPVVVQPVGRYALHFEWSDGHRTGIYTFEHLMNCCPCDACKAGRKA